VHLVGAVVEPQAKEAFMHVLPGDEAILVCIQAAKKVHEPELVLAHDVYHVFLPARQKTLAVGWRDVGT
jgi:hypothetical protein